MDADDHTLFSDELLAQLGWVRALARSLVLDPDLADDVLQQVCLVALEQAPRDAHEGPRLRAWLAAVTRGMARRLRRSEARRDRREQAAARPEAQPATAEIAQRREALRALVDAVTSLEEPYFSTIVERYFQGLSVADMAARQGLTPAAVRQRLTRARQQLRVRLQHLIASEPDGWLAAVIPLASSGASSLRRIGGVVVAKQAGSGTVAKLVAALLVLLGLTFVAWYAHERVGTSAPLAVGPGTGTPDGAAALAPRLPPPSLEPPQPLVADVAPAEAGAGPGKLQTPGAPTPRAEARESFQIVVIDADTRPVEGALVEALSRAGFVNPDAGLHATPRFAATDSAQTDPAGRCSISVAPSETVIASKAGVGASGRRDRDRLRAALDAEGDVVISLRPFVTIEGRVVNADGTPAARSPVAINDQGADVAFGPPRPAPSFFTDADGRFRATLDHSNQYLVSTAKGGVVVQDGVNPKPGETVTVLLTLPGDWIISGRVLSPDNAPLAGVPVLAVQLPDDTPADGRYGLQSFGERLDASSALDGTFALRAKEAGHYEVTALPKDHPVSASVEVAIEGPVSRPEVTLVLDPAAEIAGRVTDKAGAPVAGIWVRLQALPPTRLNGTSFLGVQFVTELARGTDEEGRFAFAGLPQATAFDLRASPSGAHGRRVECDTDWTRVVSGDTQVALAADFASEPPASSGTIHARIVSAATGQPIDPVQYYVLPEGKPEYRPALAGHNPQGLIQIPDLEPDKTYTVVARAEGFASVDVHGVAPGAEDEPLVIALPQPASLDVEAVDSRGVPLPHAQVSVTRSFPLFRQLIDSLRAAPQSADSRGLAQFTALDPGDFLVSVSALGHQGTAQVQLGSGEVRSVRVVVPTE